MNSRYLKSPSTRMDDETASEYSLDSHHEAGLSGGGASHRDDAQLEFSAILDAHPTPAPAPAAHELRKFMSEYTMCAMCDTNLEIRHEINMTDLKVKEEAHCPSCGIRVRSKHHLMH